MVGGQNDGFFKRSVRFLFCHSECGHKIKNCEKEHNVKKRGAEASLFSLLIFVFAQTDTVTENLPIDYLWLSSTATAQATVQPTIGLLPMPMRPIISTCAGTDEDPAN